jgi:hypothetical protein
MRRTIILISLTIFFVFTSSCGPSTSTDSAPPASSSQQVHANLAQLMRGVMFPASNVVFAAQGTDPAQVKQASDPSLATDPLMSTYGGWSAVENAGLALAEGANLLMVPGRMCQNGKAVPIQNADWAEMVQGLRDAGVTSYKAGQSKNPDNILMAADALTTACSKCHDKYREKPGGVQDRCM